MTCILYMMLGVATFSTIYGVCKFFLYSEDCNPRYFSHSAASAFNFVDVFVTHQLWGYVTIVFFWPTKSNLDLDESIDHELQTFNTDEEHDFLSQRTGIFNYSSD